MQSIKGNIVDIVARKVYPGEVFISDTGCIERIEPVSEVCSLYLCPGFVDAHVHIESSMLMPREFARMVVKRGTLAVMNDPHEIANVLGVPGVEMMVADARESVIKIYTGIPSCVPATPLDSSGAEINARNVEAMAGSGEYAFLSEMMNVPGVLSADPVVMDKLSAAKKYGLPVDGHAPGLKGEDLKKYVAAGISTDHECVTLEEAECKIKNGMKILIREGSAARNFDALHPLIGKYPDAVLFCTDDSHPDDVMENGHIDKLVKRALALGYDLFDVLQVATRNAVQHYRVDLGMLQVGDAADFIVVDNLTDFSVKEACVNGQNVLHRPVVWKNTALRMNNFCHKKIKISDLSRKFSGKITVISVQDAEILTGKSVYSGTPAENLESDLEKDLLKLVYLNRYHNGSPQIAYISGIGIKTGAFASSISHDSHNILAIGTNDADLADAINAVIEAKGGIFVKNESGLSGLPLPVGGIVTDLPADFVAKEYAALNRKIHSMGASLHAPLMTLSFMALLVIPQIKIGERGLFDYSIFDFLRNT
ncbi:MAG: adenine deaminase [Culturomica sp.]|jgi:adenine deaminase|nr:adenine deaminase [Culturomica sp.]